MNPRIAHARASRWLILLGAVGALGGCGGSPAEPMRTPSSSPTVAGTASGPRFIIDCHGLDGSEIGPFTRLEEAWAAPGYLRIDRCDAYPTSTTVELTEPERAAARQSGASPADETEMFATVLAVCVRVSSSLMEQLDEHLLRAAVDFCPEAPHTGLMISELETRDGG